MINSLKFKAVYQGKVFDVKAIDFNGEYWYPEPFKPAVELLNNNSCDLVKLEDVLLLEYTRFNEFNRFDGKGIFEGHIIKLNAPKKLEGQYFKVVRSQSGEWRLENKEQSRSLEFYADFAEIVGDVFNQELLNE